MYLPSRLVSLLLLFSLFFVGQVVARGAMSLDEAVESVRGRNGSRVISAETREHDGHPVHNIRLLTKDGRVKRIHIDARSGQRMQARPRPRR